MNRAGGGPTLAPAGVALASWAAVGGPGPHELVEVAGKHASRVAAAAAGPVVDDEGPGVQDIGPDLCPPGGGRGPGRGGVGVSCRDPAGEYPQRPAAVAVLAAV